MTAGLSEARSFRGLRICIDPVEENLCTFPTDTTGAVSRVLLFRI